MYIVSAILVTLAIIGGGGSIIGMFMGSQINYTSVTATMLVCIFLVVLGIYFGVMNFLINIDKIMKRKDKE